MAIKFSTKTLNTIILSLLCIISFGQDSVMYIHSWKKPKKIDKIGSDKYLEIQLHRNDSLGKHITSFSGTLVNAFPDKIVINIDDETFETRLPNGTIIHSTSHYETPDSLKKNSSIVINNEYMDKKSTIASLNNTANDHTIRTININSIYTVYYSKSKKIANVGIGLMVVSGITALLVAPPVSINFRTGHFNQNTYYSMLAASGAAFAIGLPLYAIFTKTNQYRIKNYVPDANDKNYYSIQTK